jgi:hypothetical protein
MILVLRVSALVTMIVVVIGVEVKAMVVITRASVRRLERGWRVRVFEARLEVRDKRPSLLHMIIHWEMA